MDVATREGSTMQVQTKFLRLRTPVTLGSRFDDWQVCWLGGWTRHRLSYLVMVVRITMFVEERQTRNDESSAPTCAPRSAADRYDGSQAAFGGVVGVLATMAHQAERRPRLPAKRTNATGGPSSNHPDGT